jgi:hypothetical protein
MDRWTGVWKVSVAVIQTEQSCLLTRGSANVPSEEKMNKGLPQLLSKNWQILERIHYKTTTTGMVSPVLTYGEEHEKIGPLKG